VLLKINSNSTHTPVASNESCFKAKGEGDQGLLDQEVMEVNLFRKARNLLTKAQS
jgi:hypothetical protein